MDGFGEFVHSICFVNDIYCGKEYEITSQQLLPVSLTNQRIPTLVLDLDETLIHTKTERPCSSFDFQASVVFPGSVKMSYFMFENVHM